MSLSESPGGSVSFRTGILQLIGLSGVVMILVGAVLTAADVRIGILGQGSGDFERQWAVCQYVRAGLNPYEIALRVIKHAEEKGDPSFDPWKMTHMYVPGWQEVEGVLPEYPPETTYSPPAILFLRFTAGLLPRPIAGPAWIGLNLVLLGILAYWLLRQAIPADERVALPAALFAAGVILIWPPVRSVFYSNQFSFLEMACVLMGLRESDRSTAKASAWFAIALLKPAFALVFLIYPFVRGRYAVPFLAGAVHLAALPVIGYLVGAGPFELVTQWLRVSKHFLTGLYTLQDLMNGVGLRASAAGTVAQLLFGGAAFAWCWYNRRAQAETLVDFLCFVNLLWMYHGDFDFVLLLLPAMHSCRRLLSSSTDDSSGRWIAAVELIGYAIIGAGMVRSVYTGDGTARRLIRWAVRLSLFGLLAWHAVRLGRARLQDKTAATIALA